MEKDTEKLIDKYNKSVDSLRNQELAIQKVKDKMEELQFLADNGVIKDNEAQRLQYLGSQLDIMESKFEESKNGANNLKNAINESLETKNIQKFGVGIDNIGTKIDSFKKRMTRLIGTAMVFSFLRNQLTNLRNGFLNLLKTNDNYANSLNSIKANLMTAFAPIYNACLPAINSLMNALSKLTGTIAIFISGLFGKSIDDTRKEAKKLSKELNSVGKSGKEASGSLASFDKLEVISNSSGSGSGSSVNYDGEIQYSVKLLKLLNNIKNFIVENKEEIIAFFLGIVTFLALIKFSEIIGALSQLSSVLKPLFAFISTNAVTIAGIMLIVGGLVILIQGIIDYLKEPTWENFGQILLGIGIIATGVFLIFGGFPAIITAIIGLIVALGLAIYKNWDKIKETLGKVGSWIYEHIIKPVTDFFKSMGQGIKDGVGSAVQWVKDKFKSMVDFFSNLISKIVTLFKKIGTKVGDAIGGAFKTVINGVLSAIEGILNFPIKSINKMIKVINKVPGINISSLPTFNLPRLAKGTVIPPRHEFMAVLGDQKRGTNIEAPLETIKQANREVMQEFMGSLSSLNDSEREIVLKNLTFVLQFGNNDFKKVVYDSIRLTEKELGRPLFVS